MAGIGALNFNQTILHARWCSCRVKLESEVERLRTALSVIYEISQDRLSPVWQAIENIAVTGGGYLRRDGDLD
jgi:hypothetical protein